MCSYSKICITNVLYGLFVLDTQVAVSIHAGTLYYALSPITHNPVAIFHFHSFGQRNSQPMS